MSTFANKWRSGLLVSLSLFCFGVTRGCGFADLGEGPGGEEPGGGDGELSLFDVDLQCDVTVSPASDVNATIQTLDGSLAQTVCFAPGTYKQRILIQDKSELVLFAPDGGVTLETTTPHTESVSATLSIRRSNDIQLVGLEVVNRHKFTEDLQISRAIYIEDSRDFTITSSTIRSRGKQTLRFDRSSVNLIASDLECFYFCVNPNFSEIHVKSSRVESKHTVYPDDVHSLIWTNHSNQTYEDTTFVTTTGRALLSGVNDFSTNRIIVHGTTQGQLDSWVQQHPSYRGIFLQIYGQWPTGIKDYFFNPYQGGGPSSTVRIEKFPNQIYSEPETDCDEWACTTLPALTLLLL